jgi:hypothetical protein
MVGVADELKETANGMADEIAHPPYNAGYDAGFEKDR